MAMLRRIAARLGLLGALLAVALPALPRVADSNDARQPALNRAGALFERFKQAHERGDPGATVVYATMLQRGMGTMADPQGALAVASQAARAGNAEAAIFIAESLLNGRAAAPDPQAALDAIRALARSGHARAQLLAHRAARAGGAAVSREDRIFGVEMLARAAQQDLTAAKLQLATYFIDSPGIGNRERARALLAALPGKPPLLDQLDLALSELEALGDSPTTIRLVQDAEQSARASAAQRGLELAGTHGAGCAAPAPVLNGIRAARPLRDAEFLPLGTPELATSYVIRGSWSEVWDFSVCGQAVTVEVIYQADGAGSASFSASAL